MFTQNVSFPNAQCGFCTFFLLFCSSLNSQENITVSAKLSVRTVGWQTPPMSFNNIIIIIIIIMKENKNINHSFENTSSKPWNKPQYSHHTTIYTIRNDSDTRPGRQQPACPWSEFPRHWLKCIVLHLNGIPGEGFVEVQAVAKPQRLRRIIKEF